MKIQSYLVAAASLAAVAAAAPTPAADSFHRTVLQQTVFPDATYRSVLARTVIDPAGSVPRHTHPGLELAYVLAGRGSVAVQGAAPRPLQPGDSFAISAGVVHSVSNSGAEALTLLSTYVVAKDKPIAMPAP